jgi:hypothetical protein
VAVSGTQVAYGSTVITGIQPGNALGTVPLVAQAGTDKSAASITGQITTSTGSAGTIADISLSVLQPISATVMVTIPLAAQSAATASLTTAVDATCPAKTDCASYTLAVAAANPSVGTFSTSGTQQPSAPASGPVGYTVDALASVCTPSEMKTSSTASNTNLTVAPGSSVTAATLAFSGCQ